MLPPLQASRKRLRLATSAGDICFDCGALVVLAVVEVGVGVGGGSGDGAIESINHNEDTGYIENLGYFEYIKS